MVALIVLSLIAAAPAPEKSYDVQDPARMVAEVKGMVCVFCSFTIREKLERLEFLDKQMFRKGQTANVEEGTVTLALARGKKVDFGQLYRVLYKGGYDIHAVHVNLTGTVSRKDDSMVILNEFTGQEFSLLDDAWRPWWAAEEYGSQRISIQGTIPEEALAKPEARPRIPVRVKSVRVLRDEKAVRKDEEFQK